LRRYRLNCRECLTLGHKRVSRKHSKTAGDDGTGVYMWEGTTSRVVAANRPYGEFYDFYSVSPEYFGYNHKHKEKLHDLQSLTIRLIDRQTDMFLCFSWHPDYLLVHVTVLYETNV
jgi:hypothetical protein